MRAAVLGAEEVREELMLPQVLLQRLMYGKFTCYRLNE